MPNSNSMSLDTDPKTRLLRIVVSQNTLAWMAWYSNKMQGTYENVLVEAITLMANSEDFQKDHPDAPKLL